MRFVFIAAKEDAGLRSTCHVFDLATEFTTAPWSGSQRTIRPPRLTVLLNWSRSAEGPLASWYEDAEGPITLWRVWAPAAEGRAVEGGHFPEVRPTIIVATLADFFLRLNEKEDVLAEAEIRQRTEAWAKAIRAKDIDAVIGARAAKG